MDTDTFFKFLTDKLMEIMNMTRDKALREAKAIIEEKREIIDGDYALLINKQGLDFNDTTYSSSHWY